ncbi:hypothetical protein JCM10908_002585 [Rhodotorula pacifica]|uniref:uncharacterized protein n=1 Tax=Rhodotorula pacifica TaxID=1495444 RepID=UPI0031756E81
MHGTRATRSSQAASVPASPSFQTGTAAAAASSPLLQRSASTTATTATASSSGEAVDAGTSTPAPLSAASSRANAMATSSGRSSPRGRGASSRDVNNLQLEQRDDSEATVQDTDKVDRGKRVERRDSAADGVDEMAAGHALSDSTATTARKLEDDDEQQRKRQIERVLKRAQAAKLARNFRNRVQLAAFKNQRGWQDVKLDVIEPHLEQEAQQRKQHMANVITPEQQAALVAQQQTSERLAHVSASQERLGGGPSHHHSQQQQDEYQLPMYASSGRASSNTYQPQLGGGGMDAILGGREFSGVSAALQHQHEIYHSQQHYAHPLHPSAGPPTKRPRLAATYSAQDVYAPQPLPQTTHSDSPYATTEVYQPPLAGGSRYGRLYADAPAASSSSSSAAAAAAFEHVWDSRTSPDGNRSLRQRGPFPSGMPPGSQNGASTSELYSLPAPAHRQPPQQQLPGSTASPRTRAAARRASPPKQPLSSSDPTFSSFVDAANALTGMARAPSDPALSGNGSGGDDDGVPHMYAQSGRRSVDVSHGGGGAPSLSRHSSSSAASTHAGGGGGGGYALPRPSTPERQIVKLPGAPNGANGAPGGGGGSGGDGATAEGAAELMLFLAASPSPVQSRKAPPPTLGDGMPKGRRLFSGADGDPSASSFGGELDAFGSSGGGAAAAAPRPHNPVPAPFATASPSADPSKHFATASSATGSSHLQHLHAQQDALHTPAPFGLLSSSSAPAPPPLQQQQQAPGTPGRRQRQPSLGGTWESFINASPSPKRTAAAGRRSRGGPGYGGEHTEAIGAELGAGGIGGGPGNGQAQVTW